MRVKSKYFQEDQHQGWVVWITLLIVNLIFIFGTVKQIGFNEPFGDKPMSDIGLIIFAVLILFFSISLSLFSKLQTYINSEGIYLRYLPFQWRYKFIDWKAVDKLHIIRYRPILEYGGWGFRKKRKGTVAYTVKGRLGLKIDLKNGKSVLIGTQYPEYLKDILTVLGKYGDEKG
ncbi:MAG: DUF6141 family protein [Fermentimonas sp.]|nr:DUF6141 family protein [Fermentimonas sp.]